jgi:PAP2 superfamily protein
VNVTTRRETSRHPDAGLPAGAPLRRPLRWWRELALVLLGYWTYTGVRNAVPDQVNAAEQHADQLYRLEQWLSIDIELAVNQAIDRVTWLIVGMNYYYAVAHFVVTIGVLVWFYRRLPHHYRRARTVFLVTNASALVGFYFYPLAPPRLLPELGYIDTVVTHGTWGSWASGDLAAASNQYAAMPSMHVAWSVFCAVAIFLFAQRLWVRVLGLAHPLATLVVIVATGNHFVLDAAGGLAALAAGFAVPWAVVAIRNRRRKVPPPVAEPATVEPAGATA